MAGLERRRGGVGESGKSAIREGRHGDTNCKHEVIQDHMKKIWVDYIRRYYTGINQCLIY